MTDELMEQRMAELNARNTEKTPAFDSEKRAYSVDDIMEILDISRSSAYILIKRISFGASRLGTSSVSPKPALINGWTMGDCQLYDFKLASTIAHLSQINPSATM